MSKEDKNVYYVYGCYVEGVLKYIGKGKGDRWKHCIGGTSTVKELNKDYFLGKFMEVKILFDNLSEEDALILEKEHIRSNQFLYNIQNNFKVVSVFEDCVPFPSKLLASKRIVSNTTNEIITLTFVEKIVYSFIRHYIQSKNEPCLFTQDEIASYLGIEKKSVGKAIRNLKHHNLLYCTKQPVSYAGVERWIYTGVNEFILFTE